MDCITKQMMVKYKSKPVLCVESGELFISCTQAAKDLGGSYAWIWRCCNNQIASAYGLHFRYAEPYDLRDDTRKGETLIVLSKYKHPMRKIKAVKCTESGEVFASCSVAAKALGVSFQMIWRCCVGRSKTAYGLHFEYSD